MLFKRFFDDNLAQASYMIACEKTREALIVDPNLDTAHYLRAAGGERLRIAHVTETHIHADFLSGSRALAAAAGATLHLSAEGDPRFGYSEPAMAGAEPLHDGSSISFGTIRVSAMHTPGHTPEHLTFLVSDLERGEAPVGALTGDFIFVAEVGRPDLLELVAGARGTMQASASRLFHSLKEFSNLPDHLQIWPGHGAGSACGKSLGAMPQSTLGYERLFNWAFQEMSERDFVEKILRDQPVPPRYFAEMKRINRSGDPITDLADATRLNLPDLERALADDAFVVDARTADRFAAGHVPGTLNIPFNKSFLNWCGALVPYERSLFLITDANTDDAVEAIIGDLRKIGLVRVKGFFGAEVVAEWESKRGALQTVPQMTTKELHSARDAGELQVIDVRAPDEWQRGHLPGAIHIPLAALPDRIGEIDPSVPVVLHCKGGGRSSIATSLLQSRGMSGVANLEGGYDRWAASGLETVVDDDRRPVAPKRKPRRK